VLLRKMERVAGAVCRAYNVSFEDLIEHNRSWHLVWPRCVLANVLCEVLGMKNAHVASILDRDPSAPVQMRRLFRNHIETNRACREYYQSLERELRAKFLPEGLYPERKTSKPKDQNGDD